MGSMGTSLSPISKDPLTIVVVPGADGGGAFVRDWKAFADARAKGSGILLIDDGLGFDPPKGVRVVRHPRSRGVGAAAATALAFVDTPLVLFLPANGPTTPADAKAMLERIEGAEIVVGERTGGQIPLIVRMWDAVAGILSRILLGYAPKRRASWPGLGGWGARCLARVLFGVPVADPLSGIVLGRAASLRRFPLQSTGPFVWAEILAKMNHLVCVLDEVAVHGDFHDPGRISPDAARIFRDPDFGRFRPSPSSPAEKTAQKTPPPT